MARPPASKELRKKYFNACNPDKPLEHGSDLYVDTDAKGFEARGINCIETLATHIEYSEEPLVELFTGLPGSGKSTELRRLAARLEEKKGANLLPVLIDAEEVIDLYNPIDVPEVLMAILFRTEEVLLVKEGKKPGDALKESRFARFWHWLGSTEVGVKSVDVGVGGDVGVDGGKVTAAAKMVLDFKTNPSLRAVVREKLQAHMSTFVKKVREALVEAKERATKRKYAGIVVIVDSLEKLRGGSTNWAEVLKSAEDMFKGGAPYLRLPVHVVYTLPAALAFRLNLDVGFLPMIKLFDKQGKRSEAGFAAAREIVRLRVPDEHLREFLGPTSCEERAKRLIAWSGGYPREIVRLLQMFVAQPPPDEAFFRRLLAMAGDNYRRTVPESDHAWLARVHLDKDLAIQNDEHRETADRMLQNNVVLRYHNDTHWFDVHPAVLEIPGFVEALEALRAGRAEKAAGKKAVEEAAAPRA